MQLYGHDPLHRSLTLAAQAAGVEELGGEALEAARAAVGASAALLFEFDAAALHARGGSLADPFSRYPAEAAATDVIHDAGRRWGHVPTPVIVNGWQGFDRTLHRRSAAYADFYQPAEIEQILCIHLNELPFGAPGLVGILLSRSRREDDFGAAELAAARACAAVFRGTVQRIAAAKNQQRMPALEAGLAQRRAPMLLADTAGRLSFLSPEAEALLRPLLRGSSIPPPLAEAMAAYRAFLRGERLLPAPQQVLLQRGPHQSPLRCDLFAGRSPSGEQLVGALITETARPAHDRAAAAAQRFGLTRTEAAVLAALVEGRKNAAIAAAMSVSLETVRTHVHRILGKLGVRNRTEAAHRVLSEG